LWLVDKRVQGSVVRLLSAGAVVAVLAGVISTAGTRATSISPCRQVSVPTWLPDGQQIAFYGKRWPPPASQHRNPNSILQAFCVAGADGTNARPLRYTVCNSRCPDPPYRLEWLAPNELLALWDGAIQRIAPGSKPRRIARIPDFSFVTNPTGTRLASGTPDCPRCTGPLTILSLPSGAVVGHVGGTKVDNVFETGSGTFGKLAVVDAATGTVRQLLQLNYAPTAVWSPDSSELLAYSLAKSQKCWSLSRVPVDGSAPTLISTCTS
jgi:hypothetical protein